MLGEQIYDDKALDRRWPGFFSVLVLALPQSPKKVRRLARRSADDQADAYAGRRLRPTPVEVVDAMLKVARAGKGDVLYDLGSGDGRIPIMAVEKYGVTRAVGIDINPERIAEAEANSAKAGVRDRVRFLNEDLFEAKISDATVVTLYLLNSLNIKLLPKLLDDLKPGTRVVSHAFDMGSWKPQQTLKVDGQSVYFWTIPAKGTAEHKAALAAAGKAASQ